MQKIKSKNFYLFTILFLLNFNIAHSQNIRPENLYLGSNILMSPLQNKNDLKISLAHSFFAAGNDLVFDYSINYSPIKSFALATTFRNNAFDKSSGTSRNRFYINEFGFSVGYYNSFSTKRAKQKLEFKQQALQNRFNSNKISRVNRKNEWKELNGKKQKDLEKKFIRSTSFAFNTNLSYQYAFMNGFYRSINNLYIDLPSAKYTLERYNLDLVFSCLTSSRFSYAVAMRNSMVSFNKITYQNPNDSFIATSELVEKNNPFFVVEGNFKIMFETNKINYFVKLNNIFGNNEEWRNSILFDKIHYKSITPFWSFVYGFNFNL